MKGLIPIEFNKPASAFYEKSQMNAMHRHIEEKADGSKTIIEKSVEQFKNTDIEGSRWIVPGNPFSFEKEDPAFAHKRKNQKHTVIKQSITNIDAKGNKVTDEKAVRFDDESFVTGTKTIGMRPELKNDDRGNLLRDFSGGCDPFKMLEKKNFIPIGNGGFHA